MLKKAIAIVFSILLANSGVCHSENFYFQNDFNFKGMTPKGTYYYTTYVVPSDSCEHITYMVGSVNEKLPHIRK